MKRAHLGASRACEATDCDRGPAPQIEVAITREGGDWTAFPGAEAAISGAARAFTAHPRLARLAGSEAAVVLASDAFVRTLNARYRGRDAPTNVLSFPFAPPAGAPPQSPPYLGDVILAGETVAREAHASALPPLAYLQHLVVHGLLHLAGFDHDAAQSAATMEGLEREILAALGVADPYAGEPSDGA
jgi:probable rRNA maturation factor